MKSSCSVNVILIYTILYQYSKLYSNFILNYTLSSLDYCCASWFWHWVQATWYGFGENNSHNG